MFCYTQGVEIDGSDSSYNIVHPELNKLVELVKYFLKLKIIDRTQQIRVKLHRRRGGEQVMMAWPELDQLDELLLLPDLKLVDIHYTLVDVNKLYPNVKRNIIQAMTDHINRYAGNKNKLDHLTLKNPVVFSRYEHVQQDLLTVHFHHDDKTSPYHCIELDLQPEQVTQKILANQHCVLEFNARIGANFFYHQYAVRQLADRFPELQIAVGDAVLYLDNDFYTVKLDVYERIEIMSDDIVQTIQRFYANQYFSFMGIASVKNRYWGQDYKSDQPYITPVNLPRNLAKYQRDATRGEPDVLYDILLSAMQGQSVLSIDAYLAYIEKLAQASYFSEDQFTMYSMFLCYLDSSKEQGGHSQLCRMGVLKKRGKMQLFIDVPYHLHAYVKRILTI